MKYSLLDDMRCISEIFMDYIINISVEDDLVEINLY